MSIFRFDDSFINLLERLLYMNIIIPQMIGIGVILLWNIIIQYVRQTTLYHYLYKKTNKAGINQYLNEFSLRNDYYVYEISWFHSIEIIFMSIFRFDDF